MANLNPPPQTTPPSLGEGSFFKRLLDALYYVWYALSKRSSQKAYEGTIAWNSTAPSGTTDHTYNWTQIGNLVTLNITLTYTVAGATNTQVTLDFPDDAPQPIKPISGNNSKLYPAYGYIDDALTGNPPACQAYMADSGGTATQLVIVSGSQSALMAFVTVQYFTE